VLIQYVWFNVSFKVFFWQDFFKESFVETKTIIARSWNQDESNQRNETFLYTQPVYKPVNQVKSSPYFIGYNSDQTLQSIFYVKGIFGLFWDMFF